MVQYSDVPGIEEPRHPTPNLVVTLSPTYNPIDEYNRVQFGELPLTIQWL